MQPYFGFINVHIVGLTTFHNRKKKTLKCLSDLHNQSLPNGVTLSITVVDDGSTDGTSSEITRMFPQVEILQGNGNLYWAGGMRYGWDVSVKYKSFDALLVFNDDISIKKNALVDLIEWSDTIEKKHGPLSIISGCFTNKLGQFSTYGGFVRSSKWHPLRFESLTIDGTLQRADAVNMNLALIKSEVLSKIGFLAPYFVHAGADIEFCIRLLKKGGSVFISPVAIGFCDKNSLVGTSREPGIGVIDQWKRLLSDKEEPILQRMLYFRNHGGFFWPILFIGPYLRFWLNFSFTYLKSLFRIK